VRRRGAPVPPALSAHVAVAPEDRLTLSLPLCRLVERMRHRTTPGARRAPRPGVSGEPRGLGPIQVRAMPDIRKPAARGDGPCCGRAGVLPPPGPERFSLITV